MYNKILIFSLLAPKQINVHNKYVDARQNVTYLVSLLTSIKQLITKQIKSNQT